MYNGETEVLFPPRLIPDLGELRGQIWRDLIDQIVDLPGEAPERLAFVLLMVRLGGCVSCQSDSFWAMQGCARCARNTINRFRGSDEELLERYETALAEIEKYLDRSNHRLAPKK